MNRNELTAETFDHLELIEIERRARALRAQMLAEAVRAGWARLAALLRRQPEGRAA